MRVVGYSYHGQFTWSNGHSWSRIDRFLLSSGWEERFPDVVQRRLSRVFFFFFDLLDFLEYCLIISLFY
jgi:hypothetical protein